MDVCDRGGVARPMDDHLLAGEGGELVGHHAHRPARACRRIGAAGATASTSGGVIGLVPLAERAGRPPGRRGWCGRLPGRVARPGTIATTSPESGFCVMQRSGGHPARWATLRTGEPVPRHARDTTRHPGGNCSNGAGVRPAGVASGGRGAGADRGSSAACAAADRARRPGLPDGRGHLVGTAPLRVRGRTDRALDAVAAAGRRRRRSGWAAPRLRRCDGSRRAPLPVFACRW